jgi:hypothetical protein
MVARGRVSPAHRVVGQQRFERDAVLASERQLAVRVLQADISLAPEFPVALQRNARRRIEAGFDAEDRGGPAAEVFGAQQAPAGSVEKPGPSATELPLDGARPFSAVDPT